MGECQSEQGSAHLLRGQRVLIVEDEYFIANDLAKAFTKAGLEIVGPVGSPEEALTMIADDGIGAAVLDINLDGQMVYPVADALIESGVPLVFVTGYDEDVIPSRFGHVIICQKPVDDRKVVEALGRAAGK